MQRCRGEAADQSSAIEGLESRANRWMQQKLGDEK